MDHGLKNVIYQHRQGLNPLDKMASAHYKPLSVKGSNPISLADMNRAKDDQKDIPCLRCDIFLPLIYQPIGIIKWVRTVKIANETVMRGHPLPRRPSMDQKPGRLQDKMCRRSGTQLKGDLMRCPGSAASQGAGETRLNSAVDMAA